MYVRVWHVVLINCSQRYAGVKKKLIVFKVLSLWVNVVINAYALHSLDGCYAVCIWAENLSVSGLCQFSRNKILYARHKLARYGTLWQCLKYNNICLMLTFTVFKPCSNIPPSQSFLDNSSPKMYLCVKSTICCRYYISTCLQIQHSQSSLLHYLVYLCFFISDVLKI